MYIEAIAQNNKKSKQSDLNLSDTKKNKTE